MYKCCDLEFDEKEEYLVHFESEHACVSAVSRIKCGSVGCSWTFTNSALLKKHVLNHRDKFDHVKYISKLYKNGRCILNLLDADVRAAHADTVARELSAMYAEPAMTSELVDAAIQMSENIANSEEMAEKRNALFDILYRNRQEVSREDLHIVAQSLHALSHPFLGFETEHRRMAWFEERGTLVPFDRIGARACHFDIEHMLLTFLQQPGVFEAVKKNMAACEDTPNDNFRSVLQGELWQRKKALFPGKLVIPLTLHCNDFRIMQSRVKVGVVHLNMAALPREMQPLLDFVFVAGLHYSAERKRVNHLGPILEQLNELQDEGLQLNLGPACPAQQVYFCLVNFQGKDHVLDDILERTPSDEECRFCTADDQQLKTMTTDADGLIRTVANKSVFDQYQLHYQSTENWYLDVVTDFLESVCKVDLGLIILPDLIFLHNIISVDILNHRMLHFNYLTDDKRNMPTPFLASDLKIGKIKMSAAQILCFVRNFPMMVGDLINLDEQLDSWKLFMSMRRVLETLLAETSAPRAAIYLQPAVELHHDLFKKLHGGTLPAGFHNATHYWRIVKQLGLPVVQEARPSVSSDHCFGCVDRADVLSAIAWKHQMILNDKLLKKNYTVNDEFKAPELQTNVQFSVLQDFFIFGPSDQFKSVLSVDCFRETFKIGSVVVSGLDKDGRPEFCQIEHILVSGGLKADFKLLCAKMKSDYSSDYFGEIRVSEIQPKSRQVVAKCDIKWRKCFNAHTVNGNVYVAYSYVRAHLHL
jgi:hypothetical protein